MWAHCTQAALATFNICLQMFRYMVYFHLNYIGQIGKDTVYVNIYAPSGDSVYYGRLKNDLDTQNVCRIIPPKRFLQQELFW